MVVGVFARAQSKASTACPSALASGSRCRADGEVRAARPATGRSRASSAHQPRGRVVDAAPSLQRAAESSSRGRTGSASSAGTSSAVSRLSPPVTCSAHRPRSRRVSSLVHRRRASSSVSRGHGVELLRSRARSCSSRRAWRTYQSFSCSCSSTSSSSVCFARSTFTGFASLVDDLVDAAVACGRGSSTSSRWHCLLVVPVDHVDLAVGAVAEVEDLRPLVVGSRKSGPWSPT